MYCNQEVHTLWGDTRRTHECLIMFGRCLTSINVGRIWMKKLAVHTSFTQDVDRRTRRWAYKVILFERISTNRGWSCDWRNVSTTKYYSERLQLLWPWKTLFPGDSRVDIVTRHRSLLVKSVTARNEVYQSMTATANSKTESSSVRDVI